MGKLQSGIFSTISGHNNGLIFGKARTEDGKKTTVRQYVKPTNPNTNAQQTQRSKFRFAQQIASALTPQLNTLGWDRTVGELPAYQSLISIFIQSIQMPSGALGSLPEVTLGNLYFPEQFTVSVGATETTINWSPELGVNGNNNDPLHAFSFLQTPEEGEAYDAKVLQINATRQDGSATFTNPIADGRIYAWFQNGDSGDQGASEWSVAKPRPVILP